ncbi:hypothetical protein Raf01_30160 [Rugosimonospora africana]|uniref:Uncharacterized protein n=1 Tax=Rugosimonospora africana TaxID=556532 RepID=A0A8J3VQ73_9ACTN|nr:hypothetical protein Raf01_30160 [Rugosimonospora africana]
MPPATGWLVAATTYVRGPETGYVTTGSVGLGEALGDGLADGLADGLGDDEATTGLPVPFWAADAGVPPIVPHPANAQHDKPASSTHTTRRERPTMPVPPFRCPVIRFHCLDEAAPVICLHA